MFRAVLVMALCLVLSSGVSAQKILNISVDNNGWIYMGPDTLSVDKVPFEVQQRLWKSYLGMGKMYDAIALNTRGEVLPTIVSSVKEAVKKGQEKALAEYCITKFKNSYDKLSEKDKEKVKRKEPVLFQEL